MQKKEFYYNTAVDYLENNKKFGTLIKELGSGYNGIAFLTDKGFVVKITKDEQEYKTTLKISKIANGKYTPHYYVIEKYNDLYIIIMDKVELLGLTYNENQQLNMFRDRLLDILENGEDILQYKNAIDKMKDSNMKFIFSGLLDCIIGLHKLGITNDDIQEDNIGILNNKIVLFDVVEKEKELAESIRKVIREIVKKLLN